MEINKNNFRISIGSETTSKIYEIYATYDCDEEYKDYMIIIQAMAEFINEDDKDLELTIMNVEPHNTKNFRTFSTMDNRIESILINTEKVEFRSLEMMLYSKKQLIEKAIIESKIVKELINNCYIEIKLSKAKNFVKKQQEKLLNKFCG